MHRKNGRWFLVLGTLAAAALLGGMALWLLGRPARPLPSVPGAAQAITPSPSASGSTTTAQETTVAWIDGHPLPQTALAQRQALDRALNALLDIPAMDEAAALDRLVNEVLLLNAAESAGFRVAPETVAAERETLLATYGKSLAELETALQAEGYPLAAFDAYLANLITARDFSAAQAQARGVTPEAYILELRQAHDVRFVAGEVAARAEVETPATPTATAEPVPTATIPPTAISPTEIPPTPTADAPRGTGVGQRAPGFALPLLGGEPPASLDLEALRGQPVVLSFWVTWCGHCRTQTPLLVDAHARYGAEGVQFIGVNVRETADVVQPYVTGQGILYPVVLDADGRTAQQYQISGYPTTYFLDAEGRVTARHVGQLNVQALEQYLALAR